MSPTLAEPPERIVAAPSILVVASDPTSAAIEEALAPLGHVVVVGSDRELFERLPAQAVRLVIFDVRARDGNPLETARSIRERDRDIAIIFVTDARQDDAWVLRGYELGLVEFVFEPLASEVLRAKVRTFMQLQMPRPRVPRAAAEDARARAELLANASATFTSSLAYADTLRAVAGAAIPTMADWCAVDLVDGEDVRSVAIAHADPAKVESARQLHRGQGAIDGTLRVIRSGVPELNSDEMLAANAHDADYLRLARARSAMVVPINHDNASIGAITFVLAETERRYTSEDLAVAVKLGERAGAAIANAKLYKAATDAVRVNEIFSGVVGHDLRNPLASIMAATELLLDRGPVAVDTALLQRILSSTERMARMIDQLLDFTRVRAGGGMPSNPRSTDLSDVLGEVVTEIRISHPTREIVVEERGSLAGTWDADRLAQLVSNLVSNAVEHGTGDTAVSIQADGSRLGHVTLRVSNEGSIPDALAPVVFEPFRGAEYKRHRSAGLGLGLYIAQQIAIVHGGRIELVTTEPLRTTFLVTLPRTTSEAKAS